MNDKDIEKIIDEAATRADEKTLSHLKENGRIKYYLSNSFKKTEELLYLYPNLPEGNETRLKVDEALKTIQDDEYFGVIPSKYFDGMTFAELSEIYDCKYQNISKKRNKLVKILANELFPEDVLKELMDR